MADPEVELVHVYTATAQTAKRMARATLGFTLRSRRFLVPTAAMVVLVVVLIVALAGAGGLGLVGGVLSAVSYAAVFTLVYLVLWSSFSYVLNHRNFRRIAPAGSVQRSGFGGEGFALASPLGTSQITYRAVQSADSYGGFVFIRLVGQPVHYVVPQELCPDDAMDRLRQARGTDRSRRRPT